MKNTITENIALFFQKVLANNTPRGNGFCYEIRRVKSRLDYSGFEQALPVSSNRPPSYQDLNLSRVNRLRRCFPGRRSRCDNPDLLCEYKKAHMGFFYSRRRRDLNRPILTNPLGKEVWRDPICLVTQVVTQIPFLIYLRDIPNVYINEIQLLYFPSLLQCRSDFSGIAP